MSGLREKLSRLRKPEAAPEAPPPAPEAGGEWAALGAGIFTSPEGSFVMRRRVYGADSSHGKYRLRELADWVRELGCFHGDACAEVRIEELLFFDTETTGLGVGAGNVPFLVGIGYYTEEQFVVEQLLIRNHAEEHAMLVYLHELFGRFTHLVSYNGRTFDWPLLKNRFILNRLKFDDSRMLQLDLLYPSRSLWRNTLPSCRLSKVEESRLDFERVGDVPGSMAPALYFQYLAEHDPAVLEGVLIHNEHDIVTLAALSIHFGKLLGGALPHTTVRAGGSLAEAEHSDRFSDVEQARAITEIGLDELYRTGIWLEKMERFALSEHVLQMLYERLAGEQLDGSYSDAELLRQGDPELAHEQEEILLLLAAYYKKQGVYDRAILLWLKCIELKSTGLGLQLEPYLELAMHYEHREKNYSQALHYAEEAAAKLWRRRSLERSGSKSGRHAELEDALERRLQRLRSKLAKARERQISSEDAASAPAKKHRTAKRHKPVYACEGLI